MRRLSILLAVAIGALGCATLGTGVSSAVRDELRRETLAHHVSSRGVGGWFSVVAGIDWDKREFVDLPPHDLLYVLHRCPMEVKHNYFVPVEYLRLPKEDERDPTSGGLRGIEDTRTGFRVYVLYISKIEKKRDGTYEVHYVNYNGPLAAGGGSYFVTRIGKGWSFKRSDHGWIS